MALEVLTDINPKDYFPDSKFIIEYGFTIHGPQKSLHFFRHSDLHNTPPERLLTSITYYREMEQNVSRPFLIACTEAIVNHLTPTVDKKELELGEALYLAKLLKRKAMMPKDVELMYQYAAVVFFSNEEQPHILEYKYTMEKIRLWRTEADMRPFLSLEPIRSLMPFLADYESHIEAFNQMNQEFNQEFFSRIQDALSSKQLTTLKNSNDLYAEAPITAF